MLCKSRWIDIYLLYALTDSCLLVGYDFRTFCAFTRIYKFRLKIGVPNIFSVHLQTGRNQFNFNHYCISGQCTKQTYTFPQSLFNWSIFYVRLYVLYLFFSRLFLFFIFFFQFFYFSFFCEFFNKIYFFEKFMHQIEKNCWNIFRLLNFCRFCSKESIIWTKKMFENKAFNNVSIKQHRMHANSVCEFFLKHCLNCYCFKCHSEGML